MVVELWRECTIRVGIAFPAGTADEEGDMVKALWHTLVGLHIGDRWRVFAVCEASKRGVKASGLALHVILFTSELDLLVH